jgi:hypothetical protein
MKITSTPAFAVLPPSPAGYGETSRRGRQNLFATVIAAGILSGGGT